MSNPYAGACGYNRGIKDAIREAVAIIDAESSGDEKLLALGTKIIIAIAGLERKVRYRRTRAELEIARSQEQRQ